MAKSSHQVPQLLENYKSGSAEGISLAFLTVWFIGDLCVFLVPFFLFVRGFELQHVLVVQELSLRFDSQDVSLLNITL